MAADLLINIDVDDLEKAIAFYGAALGLRLRRRLFGATAAEMSGATVPLFLLQKDGGTSPAPGATNARDYARHWTPVHFDVRVDDLAAAVSRAVEAGAVQEGDWGTYEWGRVATMADPFAHGFCLLELTDAWDDDAVVG